MGSYSYVNALTVQDLRSYGAENAIQIEYTKLYTQVAMQWQREVSTALQSGNYAIFALGLRKCGVCTL